MDETAKGEENLVLRSGEEEEPAPFPNFESILGKIGNFGLYQIGFVCLFHITNISWCSTVTFMSFNSIKPSVSCQFNDTILYLNGTSEDFCNAFENGLCENLIWSAPFRTTTEQWSLICSRDYLPQLFNSVQSVGMALGALLVGPLSDRFGRKLTFSVFFWLLIIIRFLSTFVAGPNFFTFCRFLIGFTTMASTYALHVLGMEMTNKKRNVIIACSSLWQFAFMVDALNAWLSRDWRIFEWVMSGVSAPLAIGYCCFYFESPRWLIQKGQLEKAARALNGIAKCNWRRCEKITEANLKEIRHTVLHSNGAGLLVALSKNWTIIKYGLIIMFLYFAIRLTTNAFVFLDSDLTSDPFLKFLLYGLLRLWIPVVMYLAETRVCRQDRRILVVLPMSLVFLCFLAISISLIFAPLGSSDFIFYVSLIGAVCVNCLWVPLSQLKIELFPTLLRGTAFSLIPSVGLLTGVLMPQLVYLQKIWFPLPFVIVAVITGLSLFLPFLFLPKTTGDQLPETVEDIK